MANKNISQCTPVWERDKERAGCKLIQHWLFLTQITDILTFKSCEIYFISTVMTFMFTICGSYNVSFWLSSSTAPVCLSCFCPFSIFSFRKLTHLFIICVTVWCLHILSDCLHYVLNAILNLQHCHYKVIHYDPVMHVHKYIHMHSHIHTHQRRWAI